MRQWFGIAGPAGVVLTVMAGGFYVPPNDPNASPVFADSPPTRTEMIAAIGVGPLDPRSKRASEFGRLLTQRYRNQLYAVRVIVLPDGHIELRCGANMSRHQMAEVASQVQEDARAIFGRYFPLVLYETYAAGPRRKIGEMAAEPTARKTILRFTAPPPRRTEF